MAWFSYYQRTPESEWEEYDFSLHDKVVKQFKPPFTTILATDTVINDDMKKEELAKVAYKGPFYVDFDSSDIEEAIEKFNEFLDKLEEKSVNLESLFLYASGGKGFHLLVPTEVFHEKPLTAGVQYLPLVYKEMAQALFVDTLDMRVYSMRRGRMFRTVNIERANGRFKVPISVKEARSMTPELYEELTSQERLLLAVEKPEYNLYMATLWANARDRVKKSLSTKRSVVDEKLIVAFDKKFPPTLEAMGRNECIKPGVGFQKIATQIAITANALGQSEDETLALCETLIQNHKGDGSRFSTPSKRRRELSRMYHYMSENPCYDFSVGAIKILLEQGTAAPDLELPIEDPHKVLDNEDDKDLDDDVVQGIRFNRKGIFHKKVVRETGETFLKRCSHLGIDNISQIREIDSNIIIAYEFDAYIDGQLKGRRRVSVNDFGSLNNLQKAMGSRDSASIQITDQQARGMVDLFLHRSKKNDAVQIALPKEGIDVVYHQDSDELDIVYGTQDDYGIITHLDKFNYKLEPHDVDTKGPIQSDLRLAPVLQDTPESRAFFKRFFGLFPKEIMARELGYMGASFLAQLIRYRHEKFPMLQINGGAGTGKTSFNQLLTYLFTYKKKIEMNVVGSTTYGLEGILATSASVPLFIDEFKISDMDKRQAGNYYQMFRNNYSGAAKKKGGIIRDVGTSSVTLKTKANISPLVFMGEQYDDQTALLDRCIVVNFRDVKTSKTPTLLDFSRCMNEKEYLSQLGHRIVQTVISSFTLEMVDFYIEENTKQLMTELDEREVKARPLFNNAVIMTGLDLIRQVLNHVYGDEFEETMISLSNEICTNISSSFIENKDESTKFLDTLAAMSESTTDSSIGLNKGFDYDLHLDEDTLVPYLDIQAQSCFEKYTKYMRSQGLTPLYGSASSLRSALARHPAATRTPVRTSTLKKRVSTPVVRFNLDSLYNQFKVDEFMNISREEMKQAVAKFTKKEKSN